MVTKPALLDAVTEGVRLEASDLFEFFPAPHGAVGVNTSLLYPDCDEVQVWILERDGEYVVTDYCDAHDWLRRARCFNELTDYQLSLIDDVRRSLRLEGEDLELVARTTELNQLPFLILNVALAAVRVADISYTCHPGGGLVGHPRPNLNKSEQS